MADFLPVRQRAAILAAYAPYGLTVQVDHDDADLRFTGLVQAITYHGDQPLHVALWVAAFGARKIAAVQQVRPVLYSLADLPQLPAEWLGSLVQLMDFIATEDKGAGEYVNQVTVKSASATQLHLLIGTGYTYPDNSYYDETDTLIEDEPQEAYEAGSDYEVILSAHGDMHWRRVSPEPGQREPFQLVAGAALLRAVEFLRQLQVAVGEVAHVGQSRYVHKQVPPDA